MTCKKDTVLAAAEAAAWAVYQSEDHSAVSEFDRLRTNLSAWDVAQLDQPLRRRIRDASYKAVRTPAKRSWLPFTQPRKVDVRVEIGKSQQVAALFMHAHDGYLREEAAKCFVPVDTAGRAALLLRCNDWVENVRVAALSKLRELVPEWTAEELTDLVLFTVDRINEWQRGGTVVAAALQDHREWQSALRLVLLHETNGPMARLLRKNLRTLDLDYLLPDLAVEARSAFVRAVATETILEGCARWHAATEWQWVDKVYGLRRRVQKWDKRTVPIATTVQNEVLAAAARDTSAVVRKLAAEHLIREGIEAHQATYQLLANDTSNRVRDRMDFCTRKWSGLKTVKVK